MEAYDEIIVLPIPGLSKDELVFQVEGVQDLSQDDIGDDATGDKIKGRIDFYTRREMISPVVAKLKTQAEPGMPAQIVSLYGAVNEEGEYPIVRGSNSAFNLLTLAGGLKDGAFLGSIEVF